ncbi:hypothetical protein PACTADRAFT_742, partial [Pachysolen tannophilus NRRL Y-2460]
MPKKSTAKIPPSASVPTTASVTKAQTVSLYQEVTEAIQVSYKSYLKDISTNKKLKTLDLFLVFLVALGIVQFVFCLLIGTFPFNAFLGGFISTVGQFVLTVSLRLQSTDEENKIFKDISPEKAFGDYVIASLILHFV